MENNKLLKGRKLYFKKEEELQKNETLTMNYNHRDLMKVKLDKIKLCNYN